MKVQSNLTQKPLLIVVSGAPGSGKSTLAAKLANHLSLLHLERDVFFRSLEYTNQGQKLNREHVGIPQFYGTLEQLLSLGVSLVIDGTLYKGKSERDLTYLQAKAVMVNVHCRAKNAYDRFYTREVDRTGQIPKWLDAHMSHLDEIQPLVEDPLELCWDTIEVDTSMEYNPDIPHMAKYVTDCYKTRTA